MDIHLQLANLLRTAIVSFVVDLTVVVEGSKTTTISVKRTYGLEELG